MAQPDLLSAAFPTFTDAQIDELSRCAHSVLRSFPDGEVLIRPGQREFGLFLVVSGAIDIVDWTSGEEKTVVTHHRGQFTGDISHLTGAAAMVGAVARGDCQAYEIPRSAIGMILNQ